MSANSSVTDFKRWSSAESYESFWGDRAKVAAALLGSAQWVCDLGCGQRSLRSFLPASVRYLPADLVAWTPDVATCELNANRWPSLYLQCCDIVYVLGVLEYLTTPKDALCHLAKSCPEIVISYNPSDLSDYDREAFGWVNSFTTESFLELLRGCGYEIVSKDIFERTQIIVKARSRVQIAGSSFRRRMARWRLAAKRAH